MDQVALGAVLLTSSALAVASGKSLLSLVLRLMSHYSLPATDVSSFPSYPDRPGGVHRVRVNAYASAPGVCPACCGRTLADPGRFGVPGQTPRGTIPPL